LECVELRFGIPVRRDLAIRVWERRDAKAAIRAAGLLAQDSAIWANAWQMLAQSINRGLLFALSHESDNVCYVNY